MKNAERALGLGDVGSSEAVRQAMAVAELELQEFGPGWGTAR